MKGGKEATEMAKKMIKDVISLELGAAMSWAGRCPEKKEGFKMTRVSKGMLGMKEFYGSIFYSSWKNILIHLSICSLTAGIQKSLPRTQDYTIERVFENFFLGCPKALKTAVTKEAETKKRRLESMEDNS